MSLKDFRDRYGIFYTACTNYSATNSLQPLGKELVFARWDRHSGSTLHLAGMTSVERSNHQELQWQSFRRARLADIDAMVKALRAAIPALHHPDMDLRFPIFVAKSGKPKVALQVADMKLGGAGVAVPTLMARIETAAGHLKPVSRPTGTRIFEVDGKRLSANDMESALRLWAAFISPDAFDADSAPTQPVAISEHFCDAQCLAAQRALRE